MRRFGWIILLFFTLSGYAQPGDVGTISVRKPKPRAKQVDLLWFGVATSGGATPRHVIENVSGRLTFRSKSALYFGPEFEYYWDGDYVGNSTIGIFGQKRTLIAPNTVVVVEANYHYGLQKWPILDADPVSFHNLGIGLGMDWWFVRDWRFQLMLEYQVNAIGTDFGERLSPVARINWPLYLKKGD